jgi:hypothetical protein
MPAPAAAGIPLIPNAHMDDVHQFVIKRYTAQNR